MDGVFAGFVVDAIGTAATRPAADAKEPSGPRVRDHPDLISRPRLHLSPAVLARDIPWPSPWGLPDGRRQREGAILNCGCGDANVADLVMACDRHGGLVLPRRSLLVLCRRWRRRSGGTVLRAFVVGVVPRSFGA